MSARYAPLRGTPARLVKALAQLVGDRTASVPIYPMLVVEAIVTEAWSSATFDGERHLLDLRLHGSAAAIGDALDRLIDRLPNAEFELPGQIVAEARLTRVSVDPDPAIVAIGVRIEVVTVID